MNYTNLFKIAVRAIAANKMRSFLTALGIIMSFAVCSFTGIFFGWYPAKKAAMLDPIAGFIGTQDISRVQSLQKDHVCNLLITNALHTSTVGAGFIPVLPATDKNQGKRPAAARMGINPTPTAAECCKGLSISGLHRVFCDWCHPRTTGKYIVPRPHNSQCRDSVVRPNMHIHLSIRGDRPAPGLTSLQRDHVCNLLITNVLHASTVGAGFIPVLPATDKNQGKRPAAARMVINPTTTGRVVQGP